MKHVRLYESFDQQDADDLHNMGLNNEKIYDFSGLDPRHYSLANEAEIIRKLNSIKFSGDRRIIKFTAKSRHRAETIEGENDVHSLDINFHFDDNKVYGLGVVKWRGMRLDGVDREDMIKDVSLLYDSKGSVKRTIMTPNKFASIEEYYERHKKGEEPLVILMQMWSEYYSRGYGTIYEDEHKTLLGDLDDIGTYGNGRFLLKYSYVMPWHHQKRSGDIAYIIFDSKGQTDIDGFIDAVYDRRYEVEGIMGSTSVDKRKNGVEVHRVMDYISDSLELDKVKDFQDFLELMGKGVKEKYIIGEKNDYHFDLYLDGKLIEQYVLPAQE